jgi:hypothetical protein
VPPKIPVESKKMMLKVYDYFVAESKRGAPFYSWKYSNKRALIVLIFLPFVYTGSSIFMQKRFNFIS